MPQTDAGLINSPHHNKIPRGGDVVSCRVRRNSSQLPIVFNVALRSLHRMETESSKCFSSPIAIARPDTPNNSEKIKTPVGQDSTSSRDKSVLPARKFVRGSTKAASLFGSNKPAVGSRQKVSPESESQGTEEKKGKSEKFREVTRVDSSIELASTAHSLIWQVVIQHEQEARRILDKVSSANLWPKDPLTVSETRSLDEKTTGRDGRREPKASICTEDRIAAAAAARRAKSLITSVFMDVSKVVTDASINTAESTCTNTVNRNSPKYTRTSLNACNDTVLTSVYVSRAPDAVRRDSRFISATFILDFSLLTPVQLKHLESNHSQPHLIPSRELQSSREESPAQKARRLYVQRKLICKPSPHERETKRGKASRKRTKSLPAFSTSSTEDAVVQQSREAEKSLLPRASRLPLAKGKSSADSSQDGDTLTTLATKWTKITSSPAASAASPQSDVKQRLTELQRKDETKKSPLQRTTKLPRVSRPVSIGSTPDAGIFATSRRSAAESARLLASSSDAFYPTSPSQFHLHRPWSCESTTPASKSARASRLPHSVRKFY